MGMSRRIVILIAAGMLIACGVLLGVYLNHPRLSDRQQIERVFLSAEKCIESKQLTGLMRLVDDDYNDGSFTKGQLKVLAMEAFRRGDQYNVVPSLGALSIQGNTAHVHLSVDFSTSGAPQDVQRLNISADLRKGRHGWQVIKAGGWEGAGGDLEGM